MGDPQKVSSLYLSSTLENRGVPNALTEFRRFLRVQVDLNDEDADPEEKMDAEYDLDFLLDTKDIDKIGRKELEIIRERYFTPKFRIVFFNASDRGRLERLLTELNDIDGCKTLIENGRQDVFHRVAEHHEQWIQHLVKTKVLEDKSGQTLFHGWLK